MHLGDATRAALVGALALGLSSCLILPVRTAPGLEGRVVDQATGQPVADALVVVRFDGRYDDVLPDREQLGHAETTTDPDGRFRFDRYVRAGVSAWPLFRTEARVVGVLKEGFRCPPAASVPPSGRIEMALHAALDGDDQRSSCRPVSARRGEADRYMAAWRGLFPTRASEDRNEQRRQVDRLLEARSALGFGENCQGPVSDLAIAPGGDRAAFVATTDAGAQVHLVDLGPGGAGVPRPVAAARNAPPRRLAWTGPGELLLWQPASDASHGVSPSVFAPGHTEVVWAGARPRPGAPEPSASRGAGARRPLDPEDLSDEADTLWLGRSFALERDLDPETGLSRDRLRVTRQDGSRYRIDLPGEPCGSGSRFGRPHYRIGAQGRIGLDLRYVGDGCHAVQIDLATGSWARIDSVDAPAVCRAERRIPRAHLSIALRGWTRELDATLEAAGADPDAAYTLRVDASGATEVTSRSFAGERVELSGPPFPVATPLRRIDVTNVGAASAQTPPSSSPAPAAPAPDAATL
jgi:hypothetical protein